MEYFPLPRAGTPAYQCRGRGRLRTNAAIVDDGGAAGVVDAGGVGADAVAAGDVGEVLDGTGFEKGGPGLVTGAGPVGTDNHEVVVEVGGVAQPLGETQVITDGRTDGPAAPLDKGVTTAAGNLRGFAAHAEGVGFVVIMVLSVGLDEVHAVVDYALVADGPGADEEGVVEAGNLNSEVEGGAKGLLGLKSHVVAEACVECFGDDKDVAVLDVGEGVVD